MSLFFEKEYKCLNRTNDGAKLLNERGLKVVEELRESNRNKFNPETEYRIVTFMKHELLDDLLSAENLYDEIIAEGSVRIYEKCNYYNRIFKFRGIEYNSTEANPIYGYIAYSWAHGLSFPPSIDSLSSRWSDLMGYMRLDKRIIVELNVPKELVVIGGTESRGEDLTLEQMLDVYKDKGYGDFDGVIPYVKKSWINAIIIKSEVDATYGKVDLLPILYDESSMLREVAKVSGGGSEIPLTNLWECYNHNYPIHFNLSRVDDHHKDEIAYIVFKSLNRPEQESDYPFKEYGDLLHTLISEKFLSDITEYWRTFELSSARPRIKRNKSIMPGENFKLGRDY